MESINRNWEASRKHLFEQMLKHSAPKIEKCLMCNSQNAIFRCLLCVNYIHIGCKCDEKIHFPNPFHDREVLFNGFYQKIKPTVSVDTEGSCDITLQTWPGTPTNMCHLFAGDLLDYWYMAQKGMPGVSERSFITSLEDFS
ncbi:uncharacterized protein LOC144648381 [Oculina patagonica]